MGQFLSRPTNIVVDDRLSRNDTPKIFLCNSSRTVSVAGGGGHIQLSVEHPVIGLCWLICSMGGPPPSPWRVGVLSVPFDVRCGSETNQGYNIPLFFLSVVFSDKSAS